LPLASGDEDAHAPGPSTAVMTASATPDIPASFAASRSPAVIPCSLFMPSSVASDAPSARPVDYDDLVIY